MGAGGFHQFCANPPGPKAGNGHFEVLYLCHHPAQQAGPEGVSCPASWVREAHKGRLGLGNSRSFQQTRLIPSLRLGFRACEMGAQVASLARALSSS